MHIKIQLKSLIKKYINIFLLHLVQIRYCTRQRLGQMENDVIY